MALSAPFWFIGFITDWEALPGLPVSSLMVIVPGIVAFAFVARADGRRRALNWLRRAGTPPRPRHGHWLIISVLVPPGILFAAYVGMRFVGYELPEAEFDVVRGVALLPLFILPAVFEELGWSCFALVALQPRMSALRASLLIGGVWAVWHVIPLLQVGRSIEWIVWWSLATVALRVLTTWVFNSTSRTVWAAALFHASENASWQSFPVRGSHYDPAFHALLLWLVASCGWKTLARASRSGASDELEA